MLIKSASHIDAQKNKEILIRAHLFSLPKDQGYVFAVVRFLGKQDQARTRIADAIEERLQGLEQTLAECGNVPRRFEQFIQALNQDIAQIASQERHVPLSDVHIILGVVYNQQLFVTGIGNLHALFMNRTAKQRYVIYELDQQLQQEECTWDKLFNTILDGELHPGDIFYIANRVSAREISLAELQDILVTLPPSGALKRISQHLNPKTVFGSICFQVVEPMTGGPPKKVNPITSVEHLGKTKEQTAQLLGEQEPDVGRTIQRFIRPILQALSSPGKGGTGSTLKRLLYLIVRLLILIITYVVKLLAWVLQGLWYIITHIPQLYGRGRALVEQEPTPKQRIGHAIERFNALSQLTKIAILGGIAILAITIVSVRLYSGYQTRQADIEAQMNIISSIEDKQTEAQARLIYDDEDEARQLIEEAFALIETLPSSTDKNIVDQLRLNLETVLLSIQGIEPVTLTTVASLSDEQSDTSLLELFTLGDILYATTDTQTVYSISELNGTFTDTFLTPGSIGAPIIAGIETDTTFLIIDADQQLGRGSFQDGVITPIVSGVNDLASVQDLVMYNEALYVLTADGDQIIKMRARGDGYEAGTAWITSSTSSLSDARAFAIDGDIYVVTDERIVKYRSGREQTFSYKTLDPALSNPIAIWTDTESSYLYVLDPGESRVIVMDKDGDLITQYHADELAGAVSMIVQEDKRRILIATKNEILSFSTTHLLQ